MDANFKEKNTPVRGKKQGRDSEEEISLRCSQTGKVVSFGW